MDNLPSNRLRKIAAAFAFFMIFGILHTWVIFPPILRAILKSQVVLKNGTQMRDMYNALPFPLIFKIHLFNVLNPDEVMKGAKPKLQEIGPYVFEEWKIKVDQVEDLVDDTIEFTAINYFIYNQTLSNGLTGDEVVTVINPLLTSLGLAINKDRAPLLPMVARAINEIFHEPKTVFWTGKAMDLLFDGFDVDCTSEDFNSKTICSVFESGEIKTIFPKDGHEDMFRFSLLKTANGTEAGRFKTFRGVKNLQNLGKVIEFNGETELDVWDGDECNEIRGTEMSIFPPFGSKEDGLWAFEPNVCRSMKIKYERPSKYRGVPTLRYHGDLEDISADESLHCFCSNDKCPLKGTMDLFPCTSGPIVASMPHFYNGDPVLLEKVESGLEPNKDKHAIFLDFEIISGTPMSAAKRIQFNIDLVPLQEIEVMKELPEMLFPLLWLEEGADLNKTFVNMLKYQLFLGLKFQAAVKWLSLIIGPIGALAAIFLDYQKRNSDSVKDVVQVSPAKVTSNGNNTLSVPDIEDMAEKERYMDNPPSNRLRKIAAAFVFFTVFGILHTWVIFPPILKAILKSQVVLKNGTQMRDMYNVLPFPLIYKVYLFNVLNPDEVMKGAKPKLQEMGPYVFEEWKIKVDQVEDLVDDTIEFTAINHYIYNQTLSNGLTGDEEITVINPLLTALGLAINRDRPPLLPTIAIAINYIFHEPKTAFWTGKVMDLLFNGFDVDCTSEDFNSKTVCSAFDTGDIKTVAPKDDVEDMYKFALFMTANGTDAGRYKTYRGVKNIFNLGKVIEFNGEPELDIWDGDECNEIRGTESSIFPPFGAKEDGVWAFEAGICRSIKLRYDRPSKYRGIPTLRFHGDLEDIAADESMHCYCSNDKCPLKGTIDLFPCTEGPIVASMPHFFNGDPVLLEKIDSGLVPDKDKHAIFLDLEIISGTPMSAAKRLQVNIDVVPLPEIDVMKELPEMLFPLMWVEEGADLNKTFVNMLKYQLFLGLKFQATVKWISLIVGPIGAVAVLFLDYQKRNAEKITAVLKVSPIKALSDGNNAHSKAFGSATTQELSVEQERY
ncbi:uncharacterized protein LOC119074990 [Bradysia coprophila]|uniref:uncharacterized protein LOC119074990 n=1 Tax=Bradysia coprophila TaxID=38358 RepID=UPI00187D81E4|nr:uncharacterized protein LOC119074990 [Bradysia coprophila]